jgi:hypothetical protein
MVGLDLGLTCECLLFCSTSILLRRQLITDTRSFKALALGADFVQLGRPILWGLAHEGEKGVRHVLKSLLAELEITVGLAGCADLGEVNKDLLVAKK